MMKKRILSVILCAFMLLSIILPINIIAQNDIVDGAIEVTDELELDLKSVEDEDIKIPDIKNDNSLSKKDPNDPFENVCGDYVYNILEDETAQIFYKGSAEYVKIPSTIDGYKVTKIGRNAFYNNKKLKSVTIPNSVTIIGNCAFYYCSKLKEIVIPDSVITIEDYAFYASHLSRLKIGNGVQTIGDNAFGFCHLLKTVVIPNSVTYIGDNVFTYCEELQNFKISSSVSHIGKNILEVTPFLLNIKVDESNQYYKDIDGVLFSKDGTTLYRYPSSKADTTYKIPDSVTNIAEGAFDCSQKLKSIIIPNSVVNIGKYAFSHCCELLNITIPDSVTTIGEGVLKDCPVLKGIIVGEGVKSIPDEAFNYNCDSLISVIFKGDISEIGKDVFKNAKKNLIVYYKNSYVKDYCQKNKVRCKEYTNLKPCSSIVITSSPQTTMTIGRNHRFKAKVYPEDATVQQVMWTSSHRYIYAGSNGDIFPDDPGTVVISAVALDGSEVKVSKTLTSVPGDTDVSLKSGQKKATLKIKNAKGAKKYEIYRSTKKKKGFKKIATVSKRKYTNKKLKSKKTYYYKVRGINGKYKGKYSKVRKVKVK